MNMLANNGSPSTMLAGNKPCRSAHNNKLTAHLVMNDGIASASASSLSLVVFLPERESPTTRVVSS